MLAKKSAQMTFADAKSTGQRSDVVSIQGARFDQLQSTPDRG